MRAWVTFFVIWCVTITPSINAAAQRSAEGVQVVSKAPADKPSTESVPSTYKNQDSPPPQPITGAQGLLGEAGLLEPSASQGISGPSGPSGLSAPSAPANSIDECDPEMIGFELVTG